MRHWAVTAQALESDSLGSNTGFSGYKLLSSSMPQFPHLKWDGYSTYLMA